MSRIQKIILRIIFDYIIFIKIHIYLKKINVK